jgi:hypothetical protein
MWRYTDQYKLPDISEERAVSIFRVEEQANTAPIRASSETAVNFYPTASHTAR